MAAEKKLLLLNIHIIYVYYVYKNNDSQEYIYLPDYIIFTGKNIFSIMKSVINVNSKNVNYELFFFIILI